MAEKQTQQVLDYINEHGSIDQLRAASDLNCYRLGARIYELKLLGIPINRSMVTKRTADGGHKTWAVYSIGRA